jgi:xanthine/uracil permease
MSGIVFVGAVGLIFAWLTRNFWRDGHVLPAILSTIVLVVLTISLITSSVNAACGNRLIQIVASNVCSGHSAGVWR